MGFLSKETCMKILDLNNVEYDASLDYYKLNALIKEKGLDPQAEEKDKTPEVKLPTIKKSKSIETNMNDYRKRLIDDGHTVIAEDEAEEINESIAKSKEASKNGMMDSFFDGLLDMAEKRRNKLNEDRDPTGIQLAVQEDMDFLNRIKKEPKITLFVPIERNRFDSDKSIMNKRALMKDGYPVLVNGNTVLKDVYIVSVNCHKFEYDLGVDDGVRPGVYINDVPWSIAKVIANNLKMAIQNPVTGERFTPDSIPLPPQNQIINGQVLQSSTMSGLLLGSGR